MSTKYKFETSIPSYLCDEDDKLFEWAAVRMCQEVSEYHANSLNVGFASIISQNITWVIVRSYYEILRRPQAFEPVTLYTWSRGNDGLFAYRDYTMYAADGELLLRGTSYWVIMDYVQRRAVRLKDHIQAYTPVVEEATDHSTLSRIVLPSFTDDDIVMKLKARYSMIDHTRHVNNSEYIKWVFDAAHEKGFDADSRFSVELNFQHETKPGDNVNLYLQQTDYGFISQIINSIGLSAAARITHID